MEKEELMKIEKTKTRLGPDELENLNLPSQIYNSLTRRGITLISQAITLSEEELDNLYRMGPGKIQKFRLALEVYTREDPVGRSLYQCFNAKVKGVMIHCARGHRLSSAGILSLSELQAGKPLVMEMCQSCPDYDEVGPPISRCDRGWSTKGR
jgi:hypothetical protein